MLLNILTSQIMKAYNNRLFLVSLFSLGTGIIIGLLANNFAGNGVKIMFLDCFSLLFKVMIRLFQLIFMLYLFSSTILLFYNAGRTRGFPGKLIVFILSSFFFCLILFAIVFLDVENMFNPGFIPLKSIEKINLLFISESVIPKSLIDALVHNNGLQVFVFSFFFGLAAYAVKADKMMEHMVTLNSVVNRMALMFFWLIPLTVFLFSSQFLIKYL